MVKKILVQHNNRFYQALLRTDFKSFLVKCFYTLLPDQTYLDNWHIDVIVDCLQSVELGKTRRMIINIPPRHLKSLCISVIWPAWLLGRNPNTKIIVASYAQTISVKHSLDTRQIMSSPWYKKLFPGTNFVADQNEKHKFQTTQGGFRMAVSVGSALTGEGGDFLIVDDPHNPVRVCYPTDRTNTINWFEQVLMSRLNDKKTGSIIIVMQRVHKDDLTSYLLEKKKGWGHICISVHQEEETLISFYGCNYHRKANSLLHPEREGRKEIDEIRRDLGSYAFNAQYQQKPLLLENGVIKPEWIQKYSSLPLDACAEPIIQSWDTAIKTKKGSDYSVMTSWIYSNGGFYLIDVCRGKWDYPDLKKKVVECYANSSPKFILIEDKSSGQQLLQDLKELPVKAISNSLSKSTRLFSVSSLFERRSVFFPSEASWVEDLEDELLSFPDGKHDDQVDSVVQYLDWYLENERFIMRKL